MKLKTGSWFNWPVLVVAALAFGSIPAIGVVEDVDDTLYVEFYGISGSERVYHLGRLAGGTRRLQVIYWLMDAYDYSTFGQIDRGFEPIFYSYERPMAESPLTATMTMSTARPYFFDHLLVFSDVDSKSGTRTGSGGFGTFQFYTRAAPTGAQNVSNRIRLHPGELIITGFVVQEERWVLIRGIGPSLALFEVEEPVPDVTITLHNEDKVVVSNAQWGLDGIDSSGMSTVFELAGAFSLEEGSHDSAVFLLLDPGAYTVHADSPSATEPGDALVEVYILPYE